jgi:hypothetical protein
MEDDDYMEFIHVLRSVMLVHGEAVTGLQSDLLKSHYRDRLVYYMNGKTISLADLDKLLTQA